ncbi:uncharacterized protein K452DRAFT_320082 [Aplosporella prunicola CBS 121167]|uniref:TEA domain-containing protein n=1 Tax=Aplosporella prunicola CBS 121167 TaxID=1176127 RepID=A0A6A6B8V7_9PEZI|nr:uncharacterized protein K452DRAFT_320082 [Aplosporella prunicola CBS 121167]KAF2139998.1 hypothetical protein K452DRAFT_320082 [Aplosporella prunicola CBS 121167]
MDLRRNSCIVPSNAPSLHDSLFEDTAVSRPILQERCNNRQQEFTLDSPIDLNDRPKHHGLYQQPENYYGGTVQGYLDPHPSGGSSSNSSSNYAAAAMFMGDDADDRISKEVARLWRMLNASDAYRKYRARQPKDCRKDCRDQEQKWPERMEMAFFAALVKYPPMGRRKQMHEGKLRGRNELIAYAIQKWTGESRTRKQVSSHIQVLKPLFQDIPKIMKYMSKEDIHGRRHARVHSDPNALRRRMGPPMGPPAKYDPLSQGGAYPISPLPPPHHMLTSNVPSANLPVLEPCNFSMYVRDPTHNPPHELHFFTRVDKRSNQGGIFATEAHQSSMPQRLDNMLDEKSLGCDVILADVAIELMEQTLPKDAELGIQLEFSLNYDPTAYDFISHTRLFEGTDLAHECKGQLGYDSQHKCLHAVPGTFGSAFWARKFAELSCIMRTINKKTSVLIPGKGQTVEEEAQRLRDQVRNTLAGLSAVQEISAMPRGGFVNPERILVVGWTFRHAERGHPGDTTWRRLLLPAAAPVGVYKEEQGLKQEAYGGLPGLDVGPGGMMGAPATQAPAHAFPMDQHGFELDPLTGMNLTGLPLGGGPGSGQAPPMPPDMGGQPVQDSNGLDITGGHINIFMEPPIALQNGYYDIAAHAPLDQNAVPPPPQHYDHLQQAYPRHWSGYGAMLEQDMYQQATAGAYDPTAAQQYGDPHAQMRDAKHGMHGGQYLEPGMPGGRRDSGMLGL